MTDKEIIDEITKIVSASEDRLTNCINEAFDHINQNDRACRLRHTDLDKELAAVKVKSGLIATIVSLIGGMVGAVVGYMMK